MNSVRRALALANMIQLGFGDAELPRTLSAWNRYQRALNFIATTNRLDKFPCSYLPLAVEPKQHLYMSAHYGLYAHALANIAFNAPRRRVAVLIGDQSSAQATLLKGIAARHGCEIDFIHGGFSLIKGAKRAIAADTPIFMLIDVPWGLKDATDGQVTLGRGTLRTRSAYFRLCDMLGLRPYFMLADADRNVKCHTVKHYGEVESCEILKILCQSIEQKPYLWDRWYDCQKFTEARKFSTNVIPFRAEGRPYLLLAPSFRAFKVSEFVYRDFQKELRNHSDRGWRLSDRGDRMVQHLLGEKTG